LDVIRTAGAGNFFTNFAVEGVNQRGRPTQFALALAAKDAGLILDLAREHGVPTPVAAQVSQVLVSAIGAGLGDRDWTDLVELIERQSALRLALPSLREGSVPPRP
jgi:3-hydroxyisobutyrate dehydrogenase-like beta-hydroxyacid dehydrogenase